VAEALEEFAQALNFLDLRVSAMICHRKVLDDVARSFKPLPYYYPTNTRAREGANGLHLEKLSVPFTNPELYRLSQSNEVF
jgi:hypothetical protein